MPTQDIPSPTSNATVRALRALAAVGPLSEQNLSVISLAPIRDSLGDRWPSKRDQVWSQVDPFLRHKFRAEDMVLRLDEVSVLVVQPGRPRIAAQTLAIRAANDLTRFFLGEQPFTDVLVHRVESLVGDEVRCAPVPRSEWLSALMSRDSALSAASAHWRTPIMTPMGRPLSADVSLAPLVALQSGRGVVGHVVRVVITDGGSGLPLTAEARASVQSSDLASADLAVLNAATARRRSLPNSGLPLVVPISSHTLGHSSLRYNLLQALHTLSAAERQALVIELVDLEPGAPASRLAELVSMARPHCRSVLCRMELSVASSDRLKIAGAGLSVAYRHPPSEHTLLKQEAAAMAALKAVPMILMHDLAPDLVPVATFLGVSHCTVVALDIDRGTSERAQALP